MRTKEESLEQEFMKDQAFMIPIIRCKRKAKNNIRVIAWREEDYIVAASNGV